MGKRLAAHLTFANVLAMTSLFLVLGGTSYAAVKLGKGSVKGKNVAKNAITSPKVKDGSLRYLMPELFGQPASKAIGAGG